MSKILWLASYPKSGNTWLRTFLANLLADSKDPLPLDAVSEYSPSECSASWYVPFTDKSLTDLSKKEQMELRPKAQKYITEINKNVVPLKTHNFYGRVHDMLLADPALSLGAIYIVRDPRDVVLSGAYHFNFSPDQMIEMMGQETAFISENPGQVTEFLNSWSRHVTTWCQSFPKPVFIFRYEDLLANFYGQIAPLVKKLGIPHDEERLKRAIAFSDFKVMKKQEKKFGFGEKPDHVTSFFRAGTAKSWQESLTEKQIRKIETDHGAIMRKFGYLPA